MAGGFDSLGLLPELLQAVDDLQWSLPTDIQDEAIPLILGGGDVMAAAETGSGKTAAFSLPMIQCVYESLQLVGGVNSNNHDGSDGTRKKAKISIDIKMNSKDKDDAITISGSGSGSEGRVVSSTDSKGWAGVRSTHGLKAGVYVKCNVM